MTSDAPPEERDRSTEPIAPEPGPASPARRRARVVVAVGLLVVALALALWIRSGGEQVAGATPRFEPTDPGGTAAVELVVPDGTAERVAQGLAVDAVPRTIELQRGEVVALRNDDREAAFVGPFYVPAGTAVAYRATGAGTIDSTCSAHDDGRVTVVVTP